MSRTGFVAVGSVVIALGALGACVARQSQPAMPSNAPIVAEAQPGQGGQGGQAGGYGGQGYGGDMYGGYVGGYGGDPYGGGLYGGGGAYGGGLYGGGYAQPVGIFNCVSGVPECDAFFPRMIGCINTLQGLDQNGRMTAIDAMQQTCVSIRDASQDPNQRAQFATACTQMSQQYAQSASQMGCTW